MEIKILKPVTKAGIIGVYSRDLACSKFENEYEKFNKEWPSLGTFVEFSMSTLLNIQAAHPEWFKWLEESGFVRAELPPLGTLEYRWKTNNNECPYCAADLAFVSQHYDEDELYEGNLYVEWECTNCGKVWTDEWALDYTVFTQHKG